MGSCVIKAAKDRDLYCVWSSIVEAPTYIGTREEMRRHLGPGGEERLSRADQFGTSALGWSSPGDTPVADLDGAWEDTGLIVDQRGVLRRDKMADFLEVYPFEPDRAYALLEPFDDEPEALS